MITLVNALMHSYIIGLSDAQELLYILEIRKILFPRTIALEHYDQRGIRIWALRFTRCLIIP